MCVWFWGLPKCGLLVASDFAKSLKGQFNPIKVQYCILGSLVLFIEENYLRRVTFMLYNGSIYFHLPNR